jgi:hypothetical protein
MGRSRRFLIILSFGLAYPLFYTPSEEAPGLTDKGSAISQVEDHELLERVQSRKLNAGQQKAVTATLEAV